MTTWLRQRLTAWIGVSILASALVWNSNLLRAQNKDSQPLEVAHDFFAYMLGSDTDIYQKSWAKPTTGIPFSILELVSNKSRQELGMDGTRKLLRALHLFLREADPSLVTTAGTRGAKSARFQVSLKTAPLDVALVQEKGKWKVDLIATYGQSAHLQGQALAAAIYKITGITPTNLQLAPTRSQEYCAQNLKELSRALAQYAGDNDDKLPPGKNWRSGSIYYIPKSHSEPNEAVYNCPSLSNSQNEGYALNSDASEVRTEIFGTPERRGAVLLYETTVLKRNAYGRGEALAFRHQNGANYAFADGHVKWFPSNHIPSFKLKP